MSSSASIISNQSRNTTSPNSLLLFSTSQEQDNDERIQLIVDDINQIVEKYTRELDDALRTKTISRSSSCQNNKIDILYETNKEQQKINPPPLPPKRQIGNFYLLIEHNRKYNCVKKKKPEAEEEILSKDCDIYA